MARLRCYGPPGMGFEILLRKLLVRGHTALLRSTLYGDRDFIEELTR